MNTEITLERKSSYRVMRNIEIIKSPIAGAIQEVPGAIPSYTLEIFLKV